MSLDTLALEFGIEPLAVKKLFNDVTFVNSLFKHVLLIIYPTFFVNLKLYLLLLWVVTTLNKKKKKVTLFANKKSG